MHIEAIVIRKRPVREHDQLVVLYSREAGKLRAVAKGSLRKHSTQALALDEGGTIRCELIDGRSGPIITGAQSIRSLGGAKRSALSWAAVQFFLQAIDTVVYDSQPDISLWNCLHETLTNLDGAPAELVLSVYREGQKRMLKSLGYGDIPVTISDRWVRSAMDDQFEGIAQKKLSAIDLLFDVAAMART